MSQGIDRESISSLPLFAGVDPDQIIRVLEDGKIVRFKPGDYICHAGQYDENCCIIVSGEADMTIALPGGGKKTIRFLAGEVFGEIAALSGNPRTADIIARKNTDVLHVPRRTLFKLIDNFQPVREKINKLYRERALGNMLRRVPVIAGVPDNLMDELVHKVVLESANKDERIFEQGADADAFYLIRFGFVKVHAVGKDGRERVLAYLNEGNYFGEMALLNDGEKRTASVTAINRAEMIKIPRELFANIMEHHPHIRRNLEDAVAQRITRNEEIKKNALLESKLSAAIEHGVIQTKAILIMDQTKCVQCDNCVKACAALHDGQARLVRKGTKFNDFLLIPTSCRHCEDPACMSRCPTGAITRDPNGEIWHKDFCIGCGNCARLCPFGNITVVTVGGGADETWWSKFKSKLLGLNGTNVKPGDGASAAVAPGRFEFPGDRDMVERSPADRLPGDYDMLGARARDAAPQGGNNGAGAQPARRRAAKCDMCKDYEIMGCVYNCPLGAARRVDPVKFFSDFKSVG